MTTHELDNPVWNGLTGPLAHLAELSPRGRAGRFLRDVSPFSAVEDCAPESWRSLSEVVGLGGVAYLFLPEVPDSPDGWTEEFRQPCYQMVAEDLPAVEPLDLVSLSVDDVDEMLALVELTEPGPFLRRTIELGTYVGVRREGRLVAMAGQRFQTPGWCEISAVCTHPDAQRQGLGANLTLWMAEHIRASGREAFLHVLVSNTSAARLYQSIGFRIRREIEVVGNRWQARDPEDAEDGIGGPPQSHSGHPHG